MQRIDVERWERSKLLARMLLLVGPDNRDLVRMYLDILIDRGLPPAGRPRHVLVVGAGIAGLVSSWLLARAGHRVTLVEANGSRVGGRIKTIRDFVDKSQYAEAGAMRLPDFHPLVLALVDRLGLQRRLFYNVDVDPKSGKTSGPVPPVVYRPFDGSDVWRNGPDQPGFEPPDKLFLTWFRTNSQQIRRADYALDPREINGGFNMPEALRGKVANGLINAALETVRDYYSYIDPMTEKRVNKPFPEWLDGWARVIYDFDRYSMWGFLKEVAGFSDETIEAVGTLENLTSRLPLSFFHSFLGRSDINPNATYWEIVGGTDRLTEALKQAVLETGRVDLAMGQRMIRMEYWHPGRDTSQCEYVGPDGPQVWIRTVAEEDNTRTVEYTADRAIVTIPFSSLRHVLIQPLLSYKKRRAIIELHYDSATKVLLEFRRRWWEFTEADWRRELDAIEPGLYDRYCESPGGSPQPSVPAAPAEGGEKAARTQELYRLYRPHQPRPGIVDHFFGGGSVTDNPNRFIYYPSHPVPGSPGGVILASYSWADDAARWDSLDDDERYAYALRGLVAVHGERIREFYSGRGATQSWLRNPYAFGEAAVFTPWQLTQFHLDIPTSEGPVHFAGEHTSLKHAWVEGSLESAVRAALEVHHE
ncbi:MAG TPA: NAD(P)/FAD-dependent oxidoreductase [Thermoanaerobaculia bacterium]|nr:NAD(P)/FAD-dependent oxidoreductase [Thermoanaerobaculia bacterium]